MTKMLPPSNWLKATTRLGSKLLRRSRCRGARTSAKMTIEVHTSLGRTLRTKTFKSCTEAGNTRLLRRSPNPASRTQHPQPKANGSGLPREDSSRGRRSNRCNTSLRSGTFSERSCREKSSAGCSRKVTLGKWISK